ncbi:MAG: c-type cytochrome [Deltaproteobacteria bacterium]|nr:c-type cytochrome [Deltaproteobacteria bacterium]
MARWSGPSCTQALALVVLTLLGAAACSDTTPPADVREGQALYAKYCALCHGDKGEGYRADSANALTNQDFLASVSDEFLRRGTANGRPGTPMSAWSQARGGPLSDIQIDHIVAWLRSHQRQAAVDWSKVKVGPGIAERGLAPWAVECAGCHGDAGSGGPYMTVNHPEFLASVDDRFLRRVIADGRPGTPMPGLAGILSEQHIDDLVALLRSWQKPAHSYAVDLPQMPTQPVLNPDGPPPVFAQQSGRFVPAADVKAALDAKARLLLLDARPAGDYPAFHLPGAVSVPFYSSAAMLAALPKDVWTVTYCACPHAESGALADALQSAGHGQVRVLDEGVLFWKAQGWPLHSGLAP